MTQDPWAEFRTNQPVQQAPQPQAQPQAAYPGVIQGRPRQPTPVTPIQQAQENRAEVGQNVDIANTDFDNVRAMASDFTSLPEVKNYSTVIRQLSSALTAQRNAAGDQSLIVSYARMLDPDSVVREGEFTTTAQADNTAGQTIARLQREFGMDGGGRLSDEARTRILQEMRNLAVNYRHAYEGRLADFTARSQRAGYDPRDIVGEDIGIPFNAQMRAYDDARKAERGEQDNGGPSLEAGTAAAAAQTGGSNGGDGGGASPYGPNVFDADGNPLGPQGGMGYDAEGNELGTFLTVTAEQTPEDLVDPKIAAEADAIEQMLGETGTGKLFQNIAGIMDETSGVGKALSGLLHGNTNIVENYQLGRDTERELIRRARERTGWAGTIAEGVGNLAMAGGGTGGGLMNAGRAVAARGAPITRGAVQSQLVRNAARDGATAGAVSGFGYGEGVEGSVTGAALGAAAGGIIGGGGQRIGNALSNRIPRGNPAADVVEAADALGIDPLPSMTGGSITRRATGAARQGMLSERPIASAVERLQGQSAAARNRIADNVGQAVPADDAGEIVRQAANVYSSRTSNIGGRLYDRADRMAQGVNAPLPEAVQTADRWLAEIAQSPSGANGTLAREVTRLREQMANGQFSIPGVRMMRSEIREQIQERGLRGSLTDKVYSDIARAAETDLTNALVQGGRQNAANALQTANNFWRTRVESIDQVLEPVIGKTSPRSGEQVLASLERMARPDSGNAARLRRLFDAMPREEANSVRATIINRLGRASPGAGEVSAEGSFSLERFLTHWNNMTPRARRIMFPDGSVEALDRLATVAAAAKKGGAAANTSNTAGALVGQMAISTPQLWLLEPFTVFSASAGQYGVGRLLASSRFARWLAGAPRTASPQAQKAYVSRLGEIARAEPALARELEAFRTSLAANDNAAVINNVVAGEEAAQGQ